MCTCHAAADHPVKVEEEKKVAALIAAGYASDYEGEAYKTVSGQNSNNSVRIPNAFFEKLAKGEDWELKGRMDGRVMKKISSSALWDKIAYAAWRCAALFFGTNHLLKRRSL